MKPFNSLGVLGRIGDRVYQRTGRGHGNVEGDPTHTLQNRAYVPHNTSHTEKQQARRALFTTGVTAWHALDADQKNAWREQGDKHGHTGFNAFMSNYLRSI